MAFTLHLPRAPGIAIFVTFLGLDSLTTAFPARFDMEVRGGFAQDGLGDDIPSLWWLLGVSEGSLLVVCCCVISRFAEGTFGRP